LCCILLENNLLLGIHDLAAKKKKRRKHWRVKGHPCSTSPQLQLVILLLGMSAFLPSHMPLDHSDGMKSVGKTNNFVADLPYSTVRWSRARSVYRQS
jgi:hypothetical protein